MLLHFNNKARFLIAISAALSLIILFRNFSHGSLELPEALRHRPYPPVDEPGEPTAYEYYLPTPDTDEVPSVESIHTSLRPDGAVSESLSANAVHHITPSEPSEESKTDTTGFQWTTTSSATASFGNGMISTPSPLNDLPEIYRQFPINSDWCNSRFGEKYLWGFVENKTEIYHVDPGRVDYICIGEAAIYDPETGLFDIDCELEDDVHLESWAEYIYHTGPGVLMQEYFGISKNRTYLGARKDLQCGKADPTKYGVIVKRENGHNLFHSLMEIFSYTMTLDTLSVAASGTGKTPYFTSEDLANTEIIIVDDIFEGPYWELWGLLTGREPIRVTQMHDKKELQCLDRIIVPLPGNSNPFWGDWDVRPCEGSLLLDTFVKRVLTHYNITSPVLAPSPDLRPGPLNITFIDRHETRRLVNQAALLESLRAEHPNVHVQVIDFKGVDLRRQVEVMQNTNMLVGVHGAGMTHLIFLPEDSNVVEILPPKLPHKGFRNLSKLKRHRYFSVHAQKDESMDAVEDWHDWDVYLEEERWLELMNVAIKSMNHRIMSDDDVN